VGEGSRAKEFESRTLAEYDSPRTFQRLGVDIGKLRGLGGGRPREDTSAVKNVIGRLDTFLPRPFLAVNRLFAS
jgi:hypothetical protein